MRAFPEVCTVRQGVAVSSEVTTPASVSVECVGPLLSLYRAAENLYADLDNRRRDQFQQGNSIFEVDAPDPVESPLPGPTIDDINRNNLEKWREVYNRTLSTGDRFVALADCDTEHWRELSETALVFDLFDATVEDREEGRAIVVSDGEQQFPIYPDDDSALDLAGSDSGVLIIDLGAGMPNHESHIVVSQAGGIVEVDSEEPPENKALADAIGQLASCQPDSSEALVALDAALSHQYTPWERAQWVLAATERIPGTIVSFAEESPALVEAACDAFDLCAEPYPQEQVVCISSSREVATEVRNLWQNRRPFEVQWDAVCDVLDYPGSAIETCVGSYGVSHPDIEALECVASLYEGGTFGDDEVQWYGLVPYIPDATDEAVHERVATGREYAAELVDIDAEYETVVGEAILNECRAEQPLF